MKTITLLSVLPTITDSVVIDGYTQPGSRANTLAVGDNSVHFIELNGNSAVCGALVITAGNSTVRGLVINRFNGNCANTAILLRTGGNNKVEGCFLGLDATGTMASTNRDYGVQIDSSPNNLIGGTTPAARNVIAGNNTQIFIIGNTSSGTTIQGNYIGTNAAGDAPLSSGGVSQSVTGISTINGDNSFSNTTIGGTTAGARNVISGNASANVNFFGSTGTGNLIQGNYIGINAAGTAGVALSGYGIALTYSSNFIIGGASPGARNVISGNSSGIYIAGNSNTPAANNLIQGNLIGTNAAGTAAVGNGNGIVISGGGQNNTVGGLTDAARNLISGNANRGIAIQDNGNVVQGNFIGTDITGTAKVGNLGDGIVVGGLYGLKTTGVTIGGTTAAARNVISGNGATGINLGEGATLVQGNYIGTDGNGTGNLGNGTAGVGLSGDNSTIGGTGLGTANVIAFNGAAGPNNGDGVIVFGGFGDGRVSGLNNAILGNSIFSNGRLGINLYGGSGIDNGFGVT
ncbi:MAG: hypothetical protein M3Z64_12075, partial [Verrucomicrobiota bacterium]|nr:hypothetical protein [Verrucomicrobiota bacterium]